MFASELCTELYLLIAGMRSTACISATDICLYAAKKRAATNVGPSQPLKRSRGDTESVPMRVSDIPSVIALDIEPVIALSVPTMFSPIEVPSIEVETARDEDATPEPSMAPSVKVQANSTVTIEPKLSAATQVIPRVAQSRAQSSTNFMAVSSI